MSQPPRRDSTRISTSSGLDHLHPRSHTVASQAAADPRRHARKRDASAAMLNSAAAAARAASRTRAPNAANDGNETGDAAGRRPFRSSGIPVVDATNSNELNATTLRFKNMMHGDAFDGMDSPGGFKRIRSSADSDAGSSSCKDMDEPEVYAPDSIQALINQLRGLIYYVETKPALAHGSASFMRDYLRTMLLQESLMAKEVIATGDKAHKADVATHRRLPSELFRTIPEELAKHIFSFLDGENLAKAREVCQKWNEFASEEHLWKALCLKKWKSLETDEHVWRLITRNITRDSPARWRQMYPMVKASPQWNCRLQKTGKFICNLIAHQISGNAVGDNGLPSVLIVERRFNILHLQTFILPDAAVLYFEPEKESDRAGFNDFIEYLNRRTRAGLALEDQRRFIFIPPCDYTRTQVEYHGQSLLGVVQNAYPPLAP